MALFAALSYAVTQSSRSGSGDASSEKSLVSSGELTQYPAGVRTAMVRMMVSTSINANQMEFNVPSSFGAGKAIDDTIVPLGVDVKQAVFHPSGGGATYQLAGAELMANNSPGVWYFNQNWAIPGIASSKNDLVAYLPGVSQSVCTKVDEQLGIATIPLMGSNDMNAATVKAAGSQISDGTQHGVNTPVITPDPTAAPVTPATPMGVAVPPLDGLPFACVENADKTYTYYHVLSEQ